MNVSRAGLLIRLTAPIEPHTLLSVQIFLGDDEPPTLVRGRTVRSERLKHQRADLRGLAFITYQNQVDQRWVEAIYSAS